MTALTPRQAATTRRYRECRAAEAAHFAARRQRAIAFAVSLALCAIALAIAIGRAA